MVALAFNDTGKRTGGTGRARWAAHSLTPQGSASVAQGRARQLSKGISPPFKTSLGSSKEREQFSSI